MSDTDNNDLTKLKQHGKHPVTNISKGESTTVLKKITIDTNDNELRIQAQLNDPATDTQQDTKNFGVLKQRFVLTEIIGTGGMGIVYKAKDLLKVEAKDRDPYIAIKVLSEEFKQHPDAFISLQRESRKSQRIAHPNIVNVYDFDRDGDIVFMTMEYMQGKPLDQLLREYKYKGIPCEFAFKILKHICSGLSHAHSENIIHSDLKPGNVFVTKNNVIKIFDFGIARAVAKVTHIEDNNTSKTLFDAGNLGALTPAYASLEMLQGKTPDRRDDIYALGCIAYELLTGKHPFNRVPADESQKQKLSAYKISHIKKRQWYAIESALAFNRCDRITSILDFQNKIESNIKRNYTIPLIMVVFIIAVLTGLIQVSNVNQTTISETEMRKKIAYELQLETQQNIVKNISATRNFSNRGQKKLQFEFNRLENLLNKVSVHYPESQVQEKIDKFTSLRINIINEYLLEIRRLDSSSSKYIFNKLIDNSYFYAGKDKKLIEKLDTEVKQFKSQVKIEQSTKKQNIIIRQKYNNNAAQRQKNDNSQFSSLNKSFKSILETKKNRLFQTTFDKVNIQLDCFKPLDTEVFNINIKKLRAFNLVRFQEVETIILTKLISCIRSVASTNPKTAFEYKEAALRIFIDEALIEEIEINFN